MPIPESPFTYMCPQASRQRISHWMLCQRQCQQWGSRSALAGRSKGTFVGTRAKHSSPGSRDIQFPSLQKLHSYRNQSDPSRRPCHADQNQQSLYSVPLRTCSLLSKGLPSPRGTSTCHYNCPERHFPFGAESRGLGWDGVKGKCKQGIPETLGSEHGPEIERT